MPNDLYHGAWCCNPEVSSSTQEAEAAGPGRSRYPGLHETDFEIHKITITTVITYTRHMKGRLVGDTFLSG